MPKQKQQQPSGVRAALHQASHCWAAHGSWYANGGAQILSPTQRTWLVGQALELHALTAGDLALALHDMLVLLERHQVSTVYGRAVVEPRDVRRWLAACWRPFTDQGCRCGLQ